MVTIKEVAQIAGVSIATVSRVISNSDYPVNPRTREAILQVAEDVGYSPNRAARSLRTERSSLIGVILDNFSSQWAPIIIRGIQDILHNSGYFTLVVNIPWEKYSQADVVRDMLGHSVDGFVFVEAWHPIRELRDMLNNRPYVIVHRLFNESDPYSIIPDERYNCALVVKHLLALGHKKIAYIAGDARYFSSAQRLNTYLDTMRAAGIEVADDWIAQGEWKVLSGYQSATRIFAAAQKPSAIVAANDGLAYGALLAAQDHGLRVPEDVAIVGYGDHEISRISNPTITTVTLPLFLMGQVAAENLLSQLNSEKVDFAEQLIPGELIVRQSCGAPEGKQVYAREFVHARQG